MFKWLKDVFRTKRNEFYCLNCNKTSKGKWCITPKCLSMLPKGWYYDENGTVCHPTIKRF